MKVIEGKINDCNEKETLNNPTIPYTIHVNLRKEEEREGGREGGRGREGEGGGEREGEGVEGREGESEKRGGRKREI